MNAKIFLKRGKEKPLLHHHPWIFSGAVARVENVNDGDTVDVFDAGGDASSRIRDSMGNMRDDASGQWLARASYNARSQIVARVWTFERDEQIDRAFFEKQIARALEFRKSMQTSEIPEYFGRFNAYRLINAESDFLPGVVIDRYDDFLVTQFLTLGAELRKDEIVGALNSTPLQFRGIYERSDVDVRKKEGLKETTGVLWGDEPPDNFEIVENGLRFLVDVKRGHKTGFYLDQRLNRQRAVPYLRGEVLNAFAYTGAFGVVAAKFNDAHITNLDASVSSLELARENFALNGVAANGEYVVADAFEKLREYRAQGRKFDAIVLDPPKFVTSAANLERATRGYKDLNMLAFQLLNPNGFLVTFSCSGLVDAKLFQQIVFGASVDARTSSRSTRLGTSSVTTFESEVQIVERLGQSPDHPIGLHFPEGEYLKGLVVRVM